MFTSLMKLFSRKSETRKFALINLGGKLIKAKITNETNDSVMVKYTKCRRNAFVSYWSTCHYWIPKDDKRIVGIGICGIFEK